MTKQEEEMYLRSFLNKEDVKDCIYIHGVYCALVLLRTQQDEEYYENCATIKKAIEEIFDGRWHGITTDVSNEGLEKSLNSIASTRKSPEMYRLSLNQTWHRFMDDITERSMKRALKNESNHKSLASKR